MLLLLGMFGTAQAQDVTDPAERVRRGAIERVIPIIMTALATALALAPLALSAGEPGSEIQAPMAIVILAGLLSSTVLNMTVLPALYLRYGELGRSGNRAPTERMDREDDGIVVPRAG